MCFQSSSVYWLSIIKSGFYSMVMLLAVSDRYLIHLNEVSLAGCAQKMSPFQCSIFSFVSQHFQASHFLLYGLLWLDNTRTDAVQHWKVIITIFGAAGAYCLCRSCTSSKYLFNIQVSKCHWRLGQNKLRSNKNKPIWH